MKVLVIDISILIEFSKRGLLDKMFQLEFEFAVPDLLFHEELIDLGSHTRLDLLGLGLRVETLDAKGVSVAIAYQSKRTALSLVDSFALALASHQGWPLLTEDRAMRSVADSKGIAHRDALWLIDNLLGASILSASQIMAALATMRDDPRCPVSKSGLAVRSDSDRERGALLCCGAVQM